ncbi:MAG: NAD(P)-dependent oxidoreductase [Candidatus Zixiibacteriota bacterium]|nr:MAG: NAD(P)-dependent oxidoreductase [candidate division Zixibacteria bacterium]
MSQASQKVLVTGGAGYIGSVLVGTLLTGGYQVRTIDNLSFGGESLLPHLGNPHFELVKGDITDSEAVRGALEGMDAVVHLAAVVGDPACAKQPELAVRVNKDASELLCQAAVEKRVKRFIFASTCSNYGKMPDHNGYVDETSLLRPVSLYAELKVGFENFLMAVRREGFSPVCLRFATAHGMSPRPRFDLTVNEFTRDLVTGRKLEVYGEQFWRPYCHTVDLSRACLMALEAEADRVAHRAFNVGDTGENYQKKTLVEMILAELPRVRNNVNYIHREEDPRDYRVNFHKIESALGFKSTRKVIDGIREYIFAIASGVIADPHDRRYSNL